VVDADAETLQTDIVADLVGVLVPERDAPTDRVGVVVMVVVEVEDGVFEAVKVVVVLGVTDMVVEAVPEAVQEFVCVVVRDELRVATDVQVPDTEAEVVGGPLADAVQVAVFVCALVGPAV